MFIENRINLNNNIYYVRIETEYKKDNDGMIKLFYKDSDKIFDGGDLSILIRELENNYSKNKYDSDIYYLNDIFYIYDNIPLLCGIKTEYISSKDNIVYSRDYIFKEEIEKYVKLF